jgi:hypothetical protein
MNSDRFRERLNPEFSQDMEVYGSKTLLLCSVITGISIQLSFLTYAPWATFYNRKFYADTNGTTLWSFVFETMGMFLLTRDHDNSSDICRTLLKGEPLKQLASLDHGYFLFLAY